eukprot:jgi/Bigna1/139205/aug1.49_g13913
MFSRGKERLCISVKSNVWNLLGSRCLHSNAPGRTRKILFCGTDFSAGAKLVRDVLSKTPEGSRWEVHTCQNEEVDTKIVDCDVACPLMSKFPRERIKLGAEKGNLRLIYQYGAGIEGVDAVSARELGVAVANIPAGSGNGVSTAEHAVYLLLECVANVKKSMMEKELQNRVLGSPLGYAMKGKSVVILGFGSIGKALAKRLKPFEVEITGVRNGKWSEEDLSIVDKTATHGG